MHPLKTPTRSPKQLNQKTRPFRVSDPPPLFIPPVSISIINTDHNSLLNPHSLSPPSPSHHVLQRTLAHIQLVASRVRHYYRLLSFKYRAHPLWAAKLDQELAITTWRISPAQ